MKVKIQIVDGEVRVLECDKFVELVQVDEFGVEKTLADRKERIFNYWSSEDVTESVYGQELENVLDKEDVDVIIDRLEKQWDAGTGMCWEDVENAVIDYGYEKAERKQK